MSIHNSRDHDVEKVSPTATQMEKPETTLKEDVAAVGLEKVYERHGRIDLIPLPSDDPNDPYNWPAWKKHLILLQLAFMALLGPFSAAATIPSFEQFVVDFGISITAASYTVSIIIIFIGCFPLLWAPISNRIGRRPVLLIGLFMSCFMHVAGGYTNSYGAFMTCRVFQGIFLAPAQSLGANVVNEMFFKHEKAAKMGIWTLLTSLGPPSAPFFFGFSQYHTGTWRWTLFSLAIFQGIQFIIAFFTLSETIFDRPARGAGVAQPTQPSPTPSYWKSLVTFRRRSTASWALVPLETIRPLSLFASPVIFLPVLGYSVLFSYSNVLLTVEIPSLLGRKFGLNAQQTGLQFVGAIIGAFLGELVAGRGSDAWMLYRTRKANGNREPEFRLPFAIPGFLLGAVGIIVFAIELQNAKPDVWTVTPIIGVAIAVFGLQIVTTVTYVYVTESASPRLVSRVAPFVSFTRQLYAFTAPFYLSLPFEEWGDARAGGFYGGMAGGVGILVTVLCLVFGRKWRRRGAEA